MKDTSSSTVLARMYRPVPFSSHDQLEIDGDGHHYLAHVLRAKIGDKVAVFNGQDGEWVADIEAVTKRCVTIRLQTQSRVQGAPSPDVWYLFAPIKRARLDYMVQKATELGARRITPVLTARTNVERIKHDRLMANAIEAAEQCGSLAVPQIGDEAKLAMAISGLEPDRILIFCDEAAKVTSPLDVLDGLASRQQTPKLAVLVGPEGGFDASERDFLLGRPNCVPISLGPRIMRADTAAVAVLALVMARLGDWR